MTQTEALPMEAPATVVPAAETAEAAFRRVARRKLLERGCPEEQVEERIERLLRTGLRLDPRLLLLP